MLPNACGLSGATTDEPPIMVSADAALGLFGVVEPVALLRHAVVGIGRLVRGRHQPVAQGEMFEGEGLQQGIRGGHAGDIGREAGDSQIG